MSAFGEMQPRYENHVSLDPTVKDAWGIPVARIECSHSQDDVNMVAHMKPKLPEIAAAGGLQVDKNLEHRVLRSCFALRRPAGEPFTRPAARAWATNRTTRC